MQRARHNMALLDERLRVLGFRFMAEHPEDEYFRTMLSSQKLLTRLHQLQAEQAGREDDPFTQHLADIEAEVQQDLDTIEHRIGHGRGRGGWRPPDADLIADVMALDAEHGPLPLVLRTWFMVVGEVDLTGDHPTLSCYYHHDVGPETDPLVVWYSADSLRDNIASGEYLEEDETDQEYQNKRYAFEISP